MLQAISDHWFLTEPALFALYCHQQLEENARMECPLRCGQGRIEYNPLLLKHKSFDEVEQLVRIELIRLFLKHPYEREPEGCCREAMSIGSNVTIADGYCLLHKDKLPLNGPDFYHLPLGQYYEWYAKAIQQQQDEQDHTATSSSSGTNQQHKEPRTDKDHQPSASDTDLSGLWREDSLQRQKIDDLIERTTDWGTLPADIVERIKASTKARINNRMVWQGFKSTILNSQRRLTRMRPNRRTGFLQMGNTQQFTTRLLVAIDVSGSITSEALSHFYGAVNRLFHYGMAQIDVCQFDAALGPIEPMQRAPQHVTVTGRGGTSYQPVIDYICQHHEYDGLIILTDGQAPPPQLPRNGSGKAQHLPMLWVCQDRESYEASQHWMHSLGRCCHL